MWIQVLLILLNKDGNLRRIEVYFAESIEVEQVHNLGRLISPSLVSNTKLLFFLLFLINFMRVNGLKEFS